MPQNSEQIESKLCAYVEGELDEKERIEIEKHLQANPHHRTLLAELAQTRRLMRGLPRETAPTELAEQFQGQLERAVLLDETADEPDPSAFRMNRWPQYASAAAIILLAVGLGLVVYFALPTPYAEPVNVASSTGAEFGHDAMPSSQPAEQPLALGSAGDRAKAQEAEKLLARTAPATAPLADAAAATQPDQPDQPKLPELAQQIREAAHPDRLRQLFTDKSEDAAGAGAGGVAADAPAQSSPLVLVVSAADPDAAAKDLDVLLDRMSEVKWSDATGFAQARDADAAEAPAAAEQPLLEQARKLLRQEPGWKDDQAQASVQEQQGQRSATLDADELATAGRSDAVAEDGVAAAKPTEKNVARAGKGEGGIRPPASKSAARTRENLAESEAPTDAPAPARPEAVLSPLEEDSAAEEPSASPTDTTAADAEAQTPAPAPAEVAAPAERDASEKALARAGSGGEFSDAYRVLIAENVPRAKALELQQNLNSVGGDRPVHVAAYGASIDALAQPDAAKEGPEPRQKQQGVEELQELKSTATGPATAGVENEGAADAPADEPAADADVHAAAQEEPIGAGDALRIQITTGDVDTEGEPAEQTVRVADDGTIELTQVEDTVYGEGLTPEELQQHIAATLRKERREKQAGAPGGAGEPTLQVTVERLPKKKENVSTAPERAGVRRAEAEVVEADDAPLSDDGPAKGKQAEAADTDAALTPSADRADSSAAPNSPAEPLAAPRPLDTTAADPAAAGAEAGEAEERVNVVIVLRKQPQAEESDPPASPAVVADPPAVEADMPAEAPAAEEPTATAEDSTATNDLPAADEATGAPAPAPAPPAAAAADRNATIADSEILTIAVTPPARGRRKPVANVQNVRVAEDGTIDAPHVGKVKARGRTPRQVEADILARMRKSVPTFKNGTRVRVVRPAAPPRSPDRQQ